MSRKPDTPNPPLPDEVCETIGKQLQLTLVELIALSLAGKQSQWTSYGREFVSVHRHLHLLVNEWRELQDVVAERATALGMALEWTPAAVLELDDHRPIEPGSLRSDAPSSGCAHSSGTSPFESSDAENCSTGSTPCRSTCS